MPVGGPGLAVIVMREGVDEARSAAEPAHQPNQPEKIVGQARIENSGRDALQRPPQPGCARRPPP